MLFVRFLQLLPPAPLQSLGRFANAAYPREGTETFSPCWALQSSAWMLF